MVALVVLNIYATEVLFSVAFEKCGFSSRRRYQDIIVRTSLEKMLSRKPKKKSPVEILFITVQVTTLQKILL